MVQETSHLVASSREISFLHGVLRIMSIVNLWACHFLSLLQLNNIDLSTLRCAHPSAIECSSPLSKQGDVSMLCR